ncbi:MAG TPA: 3-dehydroquinate synthase [Candidatus Salinicoccus stercoripullorum]|uniref:3-dehydroquinate synthase n=1 Tax=Candidatus Salinicoccus stercoripullorum TaxID=2838756 RepID=A0A9D1QFF2_9STAP|nr:3-dehydroquinate synthase [Candidatus Salinicoccus stercoripullorum]
MKIMTQYKDGNYAIEVARGILEDRIGDYTDKYDQVFYLADKNVYQLHKNGKLSFIEDPILMEQGEASKYFDAFSNLLETLLAKGVQRNCLLVVIGGGAAGDAGGFAAATVLRGVDYIHVPTTLLAHDSSIGGKTAINSRHGKNLIGAFHRPKGVIYDLDFLDTLPESEILSGFGEVIKHALLKDKETVDALMDVTKDGIALDMIEPFIIKGIETKMEHVLRDENESGMRKHLNLGHTLGHAIEYTYRMPHGIAVTLGIYAALYISNELNQEDTFDLACFYEYFRGLGYPVEKLKMLEASDMISLMTKDKKNQTSGRVGYIVLEEAGRARFTQIDGKKLTKFINDLKESL